MSSQKPRKLRVPTEIADSGRDRLAKDLRRFYLSFLRKSTTREECIRRGLAAIDENYQNQLLRIKDYILKRGLSVPEFVEDMQLLVDAKVEASEQWRRICVDM